MPRQIGFKSLGVDGLKPDQVALVTAGNQPFVGLDEIYSGEEQIFSSKEQKFPHTWYMLLMPGTYTFKMSCINFYPGHDKRAYFTKKMTVEAGKAYVHRCNDKFNLVVDRSNWNEMESGYYEYLNIPGQIFTIPGPKK